MNCHQLAARIERLRPDAGPHDVARLCLLLTNSVDRLDELTDDERLAENWEQAILQWHAASDQHAAMVEELQGLAATDPRDLAVEQMWILIRALKVQGRMLQMYLGRPRSEQPMTPAASKLD